MNEIIEQIRKNNEGFVQNPNFKGVRKIIVDNYSDSAHFIYELLQNADDAKATRITFDLRSDKLIIKHNGIPFNDKDVWGICNISMGTKADNYTKIGKFGIGFKAVFVYTNTPEIYSGQYQFRIQDLIIPEQINEDKRQDKKDTVFVLPFNVKKTIDRAYDEIRDKLDSIAEDAILFLSHLCDIKIIIGTNERDIHKDISAESETFPNVFYSKANVLLTSSDSEDSSNKEFLFFKKSGLTLQDRDDEGKNITVTNQSVMIAFCHKGNKIISTKDYDVDNTYFVFFPTKIYNPFEYLIHAPFITKSSRETIAENSETNKELKRQIGILSADAFSVLCDNKILSLSDINQIFFNGSDDEIDSSFKARISELLKAYYALIPTVENSYQSISHTVFMNVKPAMLDELRELLTDDDITRFSHIEAPLGLCCIYYSEDGYFNFLKENFMCKSYGLEDILNSFGSIFYEKHTSEWFSEFVSAFFEKYPIINSYTITLDASSIDFRRYPLLRLATGENVKYNDRTGIYLNNGTIDMQCLENPSVYTLYHEIYGIEDYSTERDEAISAVNSMSTRDDSFQDHIVRVKKIINALQLKKIKVSEISEQNILFSKNMRTGDIHLSKPSMILLGYLGRNDINMYHLLNGIDVEVIDPRYYDYLRQTELRALGCRENLKQGNSRREFFSIIFPNSYVSSYFFYGEKITERTIMQKILTKDTGMSDASYGLGVHVRSLQGRRHNSSFNPFFQIQYLQEIYKTKIDLEKSIELMKLAQTFENQICDWVEWCSNTNYSTGAKIYGSEEKYSTFGLYLRYCSWIYDKNGLIKNSDDLTIEELNPAYREFISIDLATKLGIKQNLSIKIAEANKKLETEGMIAIPKEEAELYQQFKDYLKKKEQENKVAATKMSVSQYLLSDEVKNKAIGEGTAETVNFYNGDDDLEDREYNSIHHKEKREENIKNELHNPDQREQVSGSKISVTIQQRKNTTDPREYEFLDHEYHGACQICDTKITKRNGDDYFVAQKILESRKLKSSITATEYLGWNTLCLCPNCAAKYRFGLFDINQFVQGLSDIELEEGSNSPVRLDIKLNGENKKIYFSPKHAQNIQVALKYYLSDENGQT